MSSNPLDETLTVNMDGEMCGRKRMMSMKNREKECKGRKAIALSTEGRKRVTINRTRACSKIHDCASKCPAKGGSMELGAAIGRS